MATHALRRGVLVVGTLATATTFLAAGCGEPTFPFDPKDPARGPGELVGNGPPVTDGQFPGGDDPAPAVMQVTPPMDGALPDCGADCESHCEGLALQNPVNRGLCRSTWGVGLNTSPVNATETCRRMFVDLLGRLPSKGEIDATCSGKSWAQVARDLLSREEFVLLQRRMWADRLLYNNTAVSIERIYDMDGLVQKTYEGRVPYDQFAAVVSAHPVLTRRYDTSGDRAEALFNLFLGRPPYENERADMARLYNLWGNGYFDHPVLSQRLPDAVIRYRCVTEDGEIDPETKGECTSVLWGYHELILKPDIRADEGEMWSGLLRPAEWAKLQLPGRIIASELGFWEHAADTVLQQYLGYDLGQLVPQVRQELVQYVIEQQGDIRALHFAVVTSAAYLQSADGAEESPYRWTYGPLKQVEVEPWIDTIKNATGYDLAQCDHRIADPEEILNQDTITGLALVNDSMWELEDDGDIRGDYRSLARTLGGCPENEVGGRFKTISILTTAAQEGFVIEVCNPTLQNGRGASLAPLLPAGVPGAKALDQTLGADIFAHQARLFLGRDATPEELQEAREAAGQCAPKPCTAEMFARPVCYAILSSSEMLFY